VEENGYGIPKQREKKNTYMLFSRGKGIMSLPGLTGREKEYVEGPRGVGTPCETCRYVWGAVGRTEKTGQLETAKKRGFQEVDTDGEQRTPKGRRYQEGEKWEREQKRTTKEGRGS